jgi:dUTP pyrophosphatase
MHNTVVPELSIEVGVTSDPEVELPIYASQQSAGADVRASLKAPVEILPGRSALIPTGLRVEIPEGFEFQVRPRSGLALRSQITVLNTPGTIDADYRGEVGVILINHGTQPFLVEPGMRIAQLVLAPVVRAAFVRRQELAMSGRGTGGFGSSGTH